MTRNQRKLHLFGWILLGILIQVLLVFNYITNQQEMKEPVKTELSR